MSSSNMKQRLLSEIHYFFGTQKSATFKTKNHPSFKKNFLKILPFMQYSRERMWNTIHYYEFHNKLPNSDVLSLPSIAP